MIDQEEIHNQFISKDSKERMRALHQVVMNFSSLPDKQKAWKDLIKLTNDESSDVIFEAAYGLRHVFPHVPDKQKAWDDLHRMTFDKDIWVRSGAAYSLGSAFSHVPDKQKAWEDLHRLSNDENCDVTAEAADTLGFVFPQIPDKQQAWNDLHRLINDEDNWVRWKAATSFKYAYSHITDKQQAWNDMHRLINEEDSNLRYAVAYFLVSAFSHVPYKQQVWDDLIKLTSDENGHVRSEATVALGSVFSHISDEQKLQVWNDLHKLTNDKDSSVRTYANHSIGKISIFKASQAEREEDYKKGLEDAIAFFEKAAQDSSAWSNPAQFCLPFYRSFHTIIFRKQEAKEEVNKYLAEAKEAVKDSKSKKLLLEAVENLAIALEEIQNLENLDLGEMKGELNFYRKYCDHAAELITDTEETAPYATQLVRKGLPILDRNLKELLEEIQKKAKVACKESTGTDTEEIACAVSKEVQKWEIGSQEEMTKNIEDLIQIFRLRMPHLLGYQHIFEEIEGIRNVNDLAKQYKIVSRLVGLIPILSSMPEHVVQDIKEIKERTTSTSNEVKYLQLSVDRLIESVSELQNQQEYLDTIQQNLEDIKNDIPEMEKKIDEVLYELYSPLSTDQKLKIAFPIIPALVSYEIETNVPKLVADKIEELKNLVLRFKKDK